MIIVDANLLLYLADSNSAHYEKTRVWFERVVSERQVIGLPWASLLAFLRISTNARIYETPFTLDEAGAFVSALLDFETALIPEPTAKHWEILYKLLRDSQSAGLLVPDADLAALALEHQATVCTNDKDFRRFVGIGLEFPLDE
jgi:uncharacterized protein